MNPIRTTHLGLRFASDISPWWLAALLPVVMLVAAWLLQRQFSDVPRSRAIGLAALRLLLLAAVAVLAFRPDIVLTETLTWLGRVIVLVDNSASMAVNDPALPPDEALLAEIAHRASQQARPIGDLRATEKYRRHCIGVMARRSANAAIRRATGQEITVPVNRALGIGAAS